MSALLARTGRHKQRYEDQFRLVAGCVPYRLQKTVKDENCNEEKDVLVLMISTPNRDDLVFPKGGWEDDETQAEAASREAFEEAGVKGILGENPLGVWEFRSKSRQNSCSLKGGCRGYIFALEVTEELDLWPEQSSHQRIWLSTEEAFKACRYEWMRDALRKFLVALSKERTNGRREVVELPVIPVSDTVTNRETAVPCGVQHLEESCTKCVVHGPFKLPLS